MISQVLSLPHMYSSSKLIISYDCFKNFDNSKYFIAILGCLISYEHLDYSNFIINSYINIKIFDPTDIGERCTKSSSF